MSSSNTIIVLEDDELLRDYYCAVLEADGYQTVQAKDSGTILEMIAQYAPLLIISDLIMPEHEGMEGIFKIIERHSIPIIAISAYPKYLQIAASLVTATLLKPITANMLADAVANILRSNQPANG